MLFTPLAGYAILAAMMAILWLIFRRISNAAVVGVGGGSGFVIIALVYLDMAHGFVGRRFLATFFPLPRRRHVEESAG